MALKWKSQKALRKVASRVKYKALFACKALSGHPVYRISVPVENVLTGTQCGMRLEHWVQSTGDYGRVSQLLSKSPYVSFLKDIKANPVCLNDAEFLKSHSYFSMGMFAIEQTGGYFDAKDEKGMLAQMRYFGHLYRGSKDTGSLKSQEECTYRSARNELIWAYQINDSSMIELDDGHHRASCMLVAGCESIDVLIVGRKPTYLQSLIRGCNGSKDSRLVEPVYAPDVSEWNVESCAKDFWSIIRKLDLCTSSAESSKRVLCITPGYGWICRNWIDLGKPVFGVFASERCAQVGRICYGLSRSLGFTEVGKQASQSLEAEIDTVCIELRDSGRDLLLGQKVRDCWNLINKPTVRSAYVALYSSAPGSGHLAELSSTLADLRGTHEVQQITLGMESYGQNRHDLLTVIALRRKL